MSTECIRACWEKADQQYINDEVIVLELMEVQKNLYFPAEEISEDVEYIGEIEI